MLLSSKTLLMKVGTHVTVVDPRIVRPSYLEKRKVT
jgi:hypothetical protein